MELPSHFDHEKLDVYHLELKFLAWVTQFLADLCGPSLAQSRDLRDQLDRASLSILLNTAEGNGRRQGRQRAKFFDDARGSAIECAAAWMLRWPKDLLFCNEFNPAKQCWFALWLCLPNCSNVLIPSNFGCARVHQTQLFHSSTSIQERRAFLGCDLNTSASSALSRLPAPGAKTLALNLNQKTETD